MQPTVWPGNEATLLIHAQVHVVKYIPLLSDICLNSADGPGVYTAVSSWMGLLYCWFLLVGRQCLWK